MICVYIHTYIYNVTSNLISRADVENEGNNEKSYISHLLQQFLKNGLEIIKKISTTSRSGKILSCRKIYGHQKMRKYHTVLNGR